jgi:hypothetical protein
MGVHGTVVMPKTAPPRSIERIRAAGAEQRRTDDMGSALALLDELVAEDMTLVHPFDDPTMVAGQGTVGLELAEDAPPLTDVLVSIGEGGLISGIAVAMKALLPHVRIWGVETEGADAMARALAAGEPVDIAPFSIASMLSAPHLSQLTLDHVRALVEEVSVASDAEAARGMVAFAREGEGLGRTGDRLPAPGRAAGPGARRRRRLTELRGVRRQRHPARGARLVRSPALTLRFREAADSMRLRVCARRGGLDEPDRRSARGVAGDDRRVDGRHRRRGRSGDHGSPPR